MSIRKLVLSMVLGIGMFFAGALLVSTNAVSLSSILASGQTQCGGICGKGWDCINADCPRCTMDNNYNWSCTG